MSHLGLSCTDVCYSFAALNPLLNVLGELCVDSATDIWMVQDNDSVPGGKHIASKFFEKMLPEAGFEIENFESLNMLGPEFSAPTIFIYHVFRPQPSA